MVFSAWTLSSRKSRRKGEELLITIAHDFTLDSTGGIEAEAATSAEHSAYSLEHSAYSLEHSAEARSNTCRLADPPNEKQVQTKS